MPCYSGKLLAISILLQRLAAANNDAQPTTTVHVSGDKPRRLSIAYYGEQPLPSPARPLFLLLPVIPMGAGFADLR